ncbi:tyrosine-type recombinase/integrase [Phycicoccus jejuensis]|uniref:tyrosine-type recombinase/integrase n=1 Tax=Phycicoccus jejuensis TaxID=367299 RepID=UPI0038503EFF
MDAEAWLTDERRLISSGAWTPPAQRRAERRARELTFDEYAAAWLESRKVHGRALADRTRDHYTDLLDRYISPTFGDVALSDITPEMVDKWYELCAVGRPTTQAHAYSLLKTILGTAATGKPRPLIPFNPADIRGAGTASRAKKVRPATTQELAVIIDAMPERRRLMVALAAWSALRFGELTELRRFDIDLKHSVIKVRRGVVRVREATEDGGSHMVRKVKSPKSEAGVRDVPVPPHLLPEIRDHLLRFTAPGRDGLLFPGQHGNHLSTSAFYGRVSTVDPQGAIIRNGHGYYEARRLAGREDLRFHDLRHTGLTNAATVGATLAELMQLAGHSTASAALRYQHASRDRLQDLAERLSQMAEGGAE